MLIRPARAEDCDAIWCILAPVIRAGESYPLPRDMGRDDALAYWLGAENEVFVAQDEEQAASPVLGTYYLRPNQPRGGGGGHVCNCGFMVGAQAGGRGIGRRMCQHALAQARARGYRAMQFNLVVSTNVQAVKLWQACGFETAGRLPRAFLHPQRGYVDALVMYQEL
ncbi:GNAT family N-acetyltransferase [Xanthobacter sp. TB0136]|uniref:GNAT family N-acetyltransferase n=1 Tax=Xanthobacter sp. TB0136 TaxID=3459177 RepID=UPI004039F5A6